jgi:hypothetical protein
MMGRYTQAGDIHANANLLVAPWDPFVVPGLEPVSAPAFVICRLDSHVVVFCPSAMGCGLMGSPAEGSGPDLYSCASGLRPVVLDTPGDRAPGLEWFWGFS